MDLLERIAMEMAYSYTWKKAIAFAISGVIGVGCISYYSSKLESRQKAACEAHGGAYVKGECYVPSKQA